MANRDRKISPKASPNDALDGDYWTRKVEWELRDAALLLVGIDPRSELGQSMRPYLIVKGSDGNTEPTLRGLSEEARKLVNAQEIIRCAVDASCYGHLVINWPREGYASVEPCHFLLWARSKGYEIAGPLKSLMASEQEQRHAERATEKATKASSEKRLSQNVERDRRIHEAAASGKQKSKQIAGAENLSPSRVREILRSPKP